MKLADVGTAHRGAFFARTIELAHGASIVFEPPNPLVSLLHPPAVDLQACADALRPRDDLVGREQQRAFQTDIGRFCSMPGTNDCELNLIGRVNVDYFLAAGKLVGSVWSPAQYLALVRDRTRKFRAAEDDPAIRQALCAAKDADDDWIPDPLDKCSGTPDLTPTDDHGCTDATLPDAPSAVSVKALLDKWGLLMNPNCGSTPVLVKPSAGAFYKPADLSKGTYILAARVRNQPAGCPVWYLFDIQELTSSGQIVRSYQVAFAEKEQSSALIGWATPVPADYIQFNPKPTDAGTRGWLGSVDGAATLKFRVRAMNGAGARSAWSEWKITSKDDCKALGFSCGL